ncbi:MAG: NAD(P)-dependent oxidoreductase [Gammaproteobacteria bacterium]|nr:NAD(P)-dependent oxidoreductase [Gammaproteobacteria bacterium]MDD9868518.1 NAD(P)-dependent oxidoreductase [Gammaproteobacteria bacterium]
MEKIAFIGLGIMGRPMAANLLAAGHTLFVHARRADAMAPLTKQGAVACRSPADAARRACVCITMVSDTPDVEEVLLGGDGVIHGAAPGSLAVDMSTISPEATRDIAARLADKEITLLDAPVSGGEAGAVEGALSIMAGGPKPAFERALPLLRVMGRHIVHIGGSGAGQVAKACNQILVAQTILACAEALEFADAAGVDAARVREALLGGFANSRILEVHGRRMLEEDYRPGFKAGLHRKDLRIASASAAAMGIRLDGLALAAQRMRELVDAGGADLDSAALARVVRENLRR